MTGASAGLGLAIARALIAETDHRLVLTARKTSLARFAAEGIFESERVLLRPLDVTSREEQAILIDELCVRFGGVDFLINNAGISYRAVVEHVSEEERLDQLAVNFLAPMELTRRVLPAMRARREGRIITISSVGGMMAMPTMAVYSASKFALEGATEALWYEVRPWGVHVSLVQPGFIHSSGFEHVRMTRQSAYALKRADDPYHQHYAHMAPFIARVMTHTPATPQSVAAAVLRTLRRKNPPLRVPATWDARAFGWLRRLLPRWIYHRLLYAMLPSIRRWGPRAPLRLPAGSPEAPSGSAAQDRAS